MKKIVRLGPCTCENMASIKNDCPAWVEANPTRYHRMPVFEESEEKVLVLVIAGNRWQFEYWLSQPGFTKPECRYVYLGDPVKLRGVRGAKIELWGQYWRNPVFDSDELKAYRQSEICARVPKNE